MSFNRFFSIAVIGLALSLATASSVIAQARPVGVRPGAAPVFTAPVLPVITPCEIDGDKKEVPLPAAFDALEIGGGGRFIILHFKELRKLGVFDVSAGKVVHYIPAAADDLLFAAGGDMIVVLLKAQKIVQRWSLKTFQRELTQTISGPADFHAMVMGSASSGPVLVTGKEFRDKHVYFDPKTFKNVEYTSERRNGRGMPESGFIRVSPDGKVFGGWRTGVSPSGLYCTKLQGGSEIGMYEHDSVGYVVPSADGRHLFTARGIFTNELKPIGTSNDRSYSSFAIPSVHGSYYITIPNTDTSRRGEAPAALGVHIFGDSRPLVTLPRIMAATDRSTQWSRGPLSLDKKFIFVPNAKVLVTYPQERNKLILHSLDLAKELEKSETDYLFVASRPPSRAEAGQVWSYKPLVRSKRGAVVMKLETGPEGMSLAGDTLSWSVPATATGSEHAVILSIKDGSGQELFHNFNIGIGGEPTGAVAVAPKVPTEPMKTGPIPEISPVDLGGKTSVEYKLPGTVKDIEVGGGGRFLCLHFPSLKKVGIFDSNIGKIAGYVPATGEDIHIAAGLNKLIVIHGASRVASRFDLQTREREVTAPVELDGPVVFATMGSACNGPLVIGTPDGPYDAKASFYHIGTMRKVEVEFDGRVSDVSKNFRSSANGKVFGSWSTGTSPSGVQVLVRDGLKVTGHYEHTSVGHLRPSPDGSVVYSARGMWNKEAKPMGSDESRRGWFVPAVHGGYYLSLQSDIGSMREPKSINFGLHIEGEEKLLMAINDVPPAFDGLFNRSGITLPYDKRMFLIPKSNLLVTVGVSLDVLHLRELDITKALDASGIDYLFVTSKPPLTVESGSEMKYPMEVKSKKGGVKYSLEAGPEGMAMSSEGEITWAVPATATGIHTVIILVGDSSGQEIYHTFRVTIKPPSADDPE